MKNRKIIITCAVTGAATKPEKTPYLPITPEQIAASALEAASAGAAVVHLHVRDPKTGRPSMDIELYRRVVELIRAENSKVLINLTTGPGAIFRPDPERPGAAGIGTKVLPAQERIRHVKLLQPEICSIDFNTMHLEGDGIRMNQRRVIAEMLKIAREAGVKPELELFDSGDVRLAKEMIAEGLIDSPPLWQFAMGIKYGWESSAETLYYALSLIPQGSTWTAFGIGESEMSMAALACIHGGNIRVGMEDNIYLGHGELAKSNAQLVAMASNLIKLLGGSVATPEDARTILGLR